MNDNPYFQTGEWVEVDLKDNNQYNGFHQIKNVYLGWRLIDNKSTLTYGYQLIGIDGKLFHGSCFKKIFEPATQSFTEMMEDLLNR